MIRNKIADKIASVGKSKEKEKKKVEEIFIPPQKRQQVVEDLKLYKNGISKTCKLLDTTSDDKDLPRFVTKYGLKFMINQEEITESTKK